MAPDGKKSPRAAIAPKRVLFVCLGNSCRSPMAEALARHLAADVIEPSSAGLSPLGFIAAPTRKVLLERGVSMDGQSSKGLTETVVAGTDLIVNMTGMPGKSLVGGFHANIVDWDVEDPYGEDLEIYQRVCDDIEERVRALADQFRTGAQSSDESSHGSR